MGSFATVLPSNMEISPCRVSFNAVDMGGTLGNVLVNFEYPKAEVKADQSGSLPIDRVVSGFLCTVVTQIAEVRDFDKLVEIFPGVRDTTVGPDRVLDFMNLVCTRDLTRAKVLKLHRLCDDDNDETNDLTFFLATPSESSAITLGPEEQSALEITWNIYPDRTEGIALNKFFRLGSQGVVIP